MKCPGQDSRSWGPEAIFEAKCPSCGASIEFFKDESSRKCRKCGHKAMNPKMNFGCATYCRFAEQCLGELSPELLAKRSDMLKDRVAAEVKRQLGKDFKRIGRTLKTVEYAGMIRRDEDADPAIITLAAYLSTLVDASSDADSGEALKTAADILGRTGAPAAITGQVLAILEELGRRTIPDSANFRCVRDALYLATLEEFVKDGRAREATGAIMASLLTESGRDLANRLVTQDRDK